RTYKMKSKALNMKSHQNQKQCFQQVLKALEKEDLRTAQSWLESYKGQAGENFNYYNLKAVIAQKNQQHDQSKEYLQKALEINPNHVKTMVNLARIELARNRYDEAIKRFDQLIKIDGEQNIEGETARVFAYALFCQKQFERAIKYYDIFLSQDSSIVESWINFASCYAEIQSHAMCEKTLRKAMQHHPEEPRLWHNLANALIEQMRFEEAHQAFEKSIALGMELEKAYNGLACANIYLGRIEQALLCFEKALAQPEVGASTQWNYSHLLLADEQWEKGWLNYEYRWQSDQFKDWKIPWVIPKWDYKTNFSNHCYTHLFVHAEQGLGDQIIFAPFADLLAQKTGMRITMSVDPRLESLMRRSLKCEIIANGWEREHLLQNTIKADAWLSMASMGHALNFKGDRHHPRKPYLISDDSLAQKLIEPARQKANGRALIGVSWRSFAKGLASHARNIDVLDIVKLLERCDAMLINLQYGPADEDWQQLKSKIGEHIIELDYFDPKGSIESVIAVLSKLDAIFGIYNATAHFAGAVGLPGAILLPPGPSWYWGNRHPTCCWYPSRRLFRKQDQQNWNQPIDHASEWLSNILKSKNGDLDHLKI
ncbi:MAG: tetratricopeptide repeat protein, partial [Pseudomonadota bacterium]